MCPHSSCAPAYMPVNSCTWKSDWLSVVGKQYLARAACILRLNANVQTRHNVTPHAPFPDAAMTQTAATSLHSCQGKTGRAASDPHNKYCQYYSTGQWGIGQLGYVIRACFLKRRQHQPPDWSHGHSTKSRSRPRLPAKSTSSITTPILQSGRNRRSSTASNGTPSSRQTRPRDASRVGIERWYITENYIDMFIDSFPSTEAALQQDS
jgi:hypothetical protein